MKFKKWLSGIYFSITGEKNSMLTSSLCGLTLKTFAGTIRSKTDQDDAWFFYLAKHHKTIYDIGANVGYTALLALIQDADRQYILIDPNPFALQKAMGNLINNNLGFNAKCYCGFVSNKNNETIKFYTLGSGAAGSMHASHAESAAAINSFSQVNTVTLDYLFEYYALSPDLVKIDVEGAETFVMEGAKKIALETKCTFFIEMHDVVDLSMKEAANKMIAWATDMGYNVWYLKTGEKLTTSETVKNRGKCHLLLLPIDKDYPNYLKGNEQNAPLPDIKNIH